MSKLLFTFGLLFWLYCVDAQLPAGAPAPDFTVLDINGQPFSLYSKMGNRGACIDFSAAWCDNCWNFHQSGILQNIYNNLSADATAVFLESDFDTNTDCLYGRTGCNSTSQGDWVTGSPYPICDLSLTNGPNVKDDYMQVYYPTVYVISPDKRAWEVHTFVYTEFVNWLTKSFKLAATATPVGCTCGSNGKIFLNPSNGYGFLAYSWSNGGSTKDLDNVAGGNYTVTITDENGYFKSFGPWTVANPPKQVDIISSQLNHVKCYNEADGSIEIQAGYGTPPYTYAWSNGKTTKNIDNLKAGPYSITVTDNVGCTRIRYYTITQPTILNFSATTSKDECDKNNGSITAKALGGAPPYLYNIGLGAQQIPVFKDLKGGKSYILTLTDENTCTQTLQVSIDVTHKPKSDPGSGKDFTDCIKESLSLDGSKSSLGANISYLWTTTDGNILQDAETLSPEINKAGTYSLKVTDATNKCADTAYLKVADQRIYPNVNTHGDTILNCALTEITLEGKSDSLPVIFYWNKAYDSLFYKSGKNLVTADSGAYIFYVVDSLNACASKDTVFVQKDQLKPISSASALTDVSCKYTEVVIDGSASSQGPNISYLWSTVDGHIISATNTLQAFVDKGGDYVLLVQNSTNYCEQTASVSIRQQTDINAKFSQTILDLSVQFDDQSTGIPIAWFWTFGETGSPNNTSTEKNPTHNYAMQGEYEICLEVENDCGKTQTCHNALVGIQNALQLLSWDIISPTCFGEHNGAILLKLQGGLPPYNFLWSNQQTTKDLQTVVAGNYSVEITDQQGSKINQAFEIIQPDDILVDHADIANSSAGQNNGSILLNMKGNLSFAFLWSNGQTSNPIQNLAAGDYSCTVTDTNGCVKEFGPYTIAELTITDGIADGEDGNADFADGIIKFNVQPNPVNEKGIIDLKFSRDKKYRIELMNIYGVRIWSNNFQNKEMALPIDVSNFTKGVYFVVLRTDKAQRVVKWVVD